MPTTIFQVPEKYEYLNGFGSYHETEAIPGALPVGMNSPQKPPYGLYVEKFSGTAFTAPRKENQQSWLLRILPAAAHEPFVKSAKTLSGHSDRGAQQFEQIPNQLRWDPFDIAPGTDFLSGLELVSGAGDPATKTGLAIYIYAASQSMEKNQAFYSADGDFLIVAQQGALDIQTELGKLLVRTNEIAVIPRGVRFRVDLVEGSGDARGYILELFQGHFQLPDLGPIGSNCLANVRDFQAPVAFYEDDESPWCVTAKFGGQLFEARQNHSPFDVVAWHGNYYPYKYDLGRFNTVGSISFDHPDPSIFTVLTAPSPVVGTAVADFVIFPPRWLVAEGTFRPPWYHRNTMSEFMGLISGSYDAKAGGKGGFQPGGASLHNVMGAHGPDAGSYEKATNAELAPQKVGDGAMAFMFESSLMLGVTEWSLRKCQKVQDLYNEHSWGSWERTSSVGIACPETPSAPQVVFPKPSPHFRQISTAPASSDSSCSSSQCPVPYGIMPSGVQSPIVQNSSLEHLHFLFHFFDSFNFASSTLNVDVNFAHVSIFVLIFFLVMAATLSQATMTNIRKRRTPYTTVACVSCKQRKTKCSGERPCRGCRRIGVPCAYERVTRFQNNSRQSGQNGAKERRKGSDQDPNQISNSDRNPPPASVGSRSSVSASASEPTESATTAFQLRPTSLDYYLRLAEKRLGALSPEEAVSSPPEGRPPIIGERTIRTLTEARKRECPGAALAAFSLEHWKGMLQIWAEEVGLQYPFIDPDTLAHDIVGASREPDPNNNSPASAPASTPGSTGSNHRRHVEDTAILILVVVAILVDPTLVATANPLAEAIYRDVLVRTHIADVDRGDVSLMAVAASYFFLSDREVLAWRAISGVMRLLQEERVLQNYDEPQQASSAAASSATSGDDRLYWSAFTMERRFSFSTGLPFAVRDTDIQHWPHFTDTSMSSAYLKSMVDYCRISSEVRKLLLLPAAPPAPYALTATRDFLDFRVVQWQKNLPAALVFNGVRDTFDPTRERRGEYRLRLILYLRGSQMRTVIHRKSGLAALSSGSGLASNTNTSAFDPASANTLALIAQDTIRILVALERDTDIYHAQHKTFNHFLETALTSLLLCAGTTQSTAFISFLPDVMEAMALVERLSMHSPITKALSIKLRGVQSVVNAFRQRVEEQQAAAAQAQEAREANGEAQDQNQNQNQPLSRAAILPAQEFYLSQNNQVPAPQSVPEQSMSGMSRVPLNPGVGAPVHPPISGQRLSFELGRFFPPDLPSQAVGSVSNPELPLNGTTGVTGGPAAVNPGMDFLPAFDLNSPMFDILGVGNILDDYENFAF